MRKLTIVFSFMLAAALCPLFLSNAFSQQRASGGQRQPMTPEKRLERLDKEVGGLTADQKKKILALWEEQENNVEKQPPSDEERPNARREQLKQNQQQSKQGGGRFGGFGGLSPEVEKILTPDQVKKFKTNMTERRIDQQIERLSDLNLTDDQKKKLRAVFEKENVSMQKMMEKMKDSQDDRKVMMDTFRKMREENEKEIVKVLTPDQKKKYEEMQEKMKEMMQRRGQGGPGGGPDGGPGGGPGGPGGPDR